MCLWGGTCVRVRRDDVHKASGGEAVDVRQQLLVSHACSRQRQQRVQRQSPPDGGSTSCLTQHTLTHSACREAQ
jgi:hypothetical protein